MREDHRPSPQEALELLYRATVYRAPRVRSIDSDAVPQPYRRVLVHRRSMTAALEEYCGERVELVVMYRHADSHRYVRRGLLCDGFAHRSLMLCGLFIERSGIEASLWADVVWERAPVGRLLADHGLYVGHRPRGFFTLLCDGVMSRLLQIEEERRLFGRCNVLVGAGEERILSTIEICAPDVGAAGRAFEARGAGLSWGAEG